MSDYGSTHSKYGSGTLHAEGSIPATRFDLDHWMKTLAAVEWQNKGTQAREAVTVWDSNQRRGSVLTN
jgi:hypothetical protein